jgi:hypothetical protein
MPTETMFAIIAIIIPFLILAMALAYADYQTNRAKRL